MLTNTQFSYAVTHALFIYMFQKLSSLHWQGRNSGDADISVIFP